MSIHPRRGPAARVFALLALGLVLAALFACASPPSSVVPGPAPGGEAPAATPAPPAAPAADGTEEEYGLLDGWEEVPPLLPVEKPAGWQSPVERHGRLAVKGTKLVDAKGEPVQLRGFSTGNLAISDQFLDEAYVSELAYVFKVDIIRLAMYTHGLSGGYYGNAGIADLTLEKARLLAEYGIYCIVDWHILVDGNPMDTLEGAKEFFARAALELKDLPNVIWEICNEPNGPAVTWKGAIKPYAEQIIPLIRRTIPDALILVGTPTWSQDVDQAADAPLGFANVMYVVHFYAGTHGQSLRDKVSYALGKGAPIFCTEWGTSIADGGKDMVVYREETLVWIDFLDKLGISWCNWQLNDMQGEASSAIEHDLPDAGKRLEARLSESGRLLKELILRGR